MLTTVQSAPIKGVNCGEAKTSEKPSVIMDLSWSLQPQKHHSRMAWVSDLIEHLEKWYAAYYIVQG
jgi:hypothetical protein